MTTVCSFIRSRRAITVLVAAGAALLIAGSAPGPAQAQATIAPMIFTGILRVGATPQSGAIIVAITAESFAQGITCGTGYSGAGGRYRLEIAAVAPACVRQTHEDAYFSYLFVSNGVSVGAFMDRVVALDDPASYRVHVHDLQMEDVPVDVEEAPPGAPSLPREPQEPGSSRGITRPGAIPAANPSGVVAHRFWGPLRLAGKKASEGTIVEVAVDNGSGLRTCGRGYVGAGGLFLVDVKVIPGCVRTWPEEEMTYIFVVAGEKVGSYYDRWVSLRSFTSLGHVRKLNLSGKVGQ